MKLFNSIEVGEISVIPEALNSSSIKITGKWDAFAVSWDPITRVNHGQIFYEFKMEFRNTLFIEVSNSIHALICTSNVLFSFQNVTTLNFIVYSEQDIPPFSSLDVFIRPYTYWGAAPISRVRLYSPQVLPSQPNRPRIFVTHQNNLIRSVGIYFKIVVTTAFINIQI
jgi:hypothetical protein